MAELLSVCIPTYNRADYLAELVEKLIAAFQTLPLALKDKVRFFVSDNSSTDNTADVATRAKKHLPLVYWRNDANVGAERNCFKLIEASQGDYRWIIGDDDLIEKDCLQTLLQLLQDRQPTLVVLKVNDPSGQMDPRFRDISSWYGDFSKFVDFASRRNPALLVAMSLVSCNVFRGEFYDLAFARRIWETSHYPYSWLYGMVNNLGQTSGPVLLPDSPRIMLRDNTARGPVRARAATTLPRNFNLDWRVRCYLVWMTQRYGRPAIAQWARKQYPLMRVHPLAHWALGWWYYFYYGLKKRVFQTRQ
jgi:glycosyltransferase involved in cell wall biosynthesis